MLRLLLLITRLQPEASRLSKGRCLSVGNRHTLPSDRTQWRQFYSDKESVRSQRERTCVAPGDKKTLLLHRFRASELE